MSYQLFCTTACSPPNELDQEVTLLWTQLPDQTWDYCNKGISAWAKHMAKYGVVVASRFDFDSESELAERITWDIQHFTQYGDLVADPFCGGSTVGEMALRLGRNYVGTDISQIAIDRSETRLYGLS